MRVKEWLAVSTGILFVGVVPVWLVWDKIAAAGDQFDSRGEGQCLA
jgi:hypothetical protein